MITAIMLTLGMLCFEKPQEIKVPVRKDNCNKYF
jgi:hypothetical protein